MKKTTTCLLILCFSLVCINLNAQHELWGMTHGEFPNRNVPGAGTWGVIFKTDSAGNNFSVEHMFTSYERNSKGTLIQATNGKYYGMSEAGGLYDYGTIFEYDYSNDSVKVLHNFDGTATGSYPKGDLVQASNGKLYGMTQRGGTQNNNGVVFEFDLSDNSLTVIYEFGEYPKGRLPVGSLIQASDGKLYGMTEYGGELGASGSGTLFEIDLSGPTLTRIHNFSHTSVDGLSPTGNLIQLSDSLLYGLTPLGGDLSQGTIFNFNINSSTHTKLGDFSESTVGGYPHGSPMKALNGNLYGLYSDGYCCGGIFEYDMVDDTLVQIYDFNYGEGTGPAYTNLIEGDSNMFLGMTNRGGTHDDGAIFKYNLSSDTYTKLYDFDFNDASNANVYGSLIESSPGKYLLMTRVSGTARVGTISEWDTATSTYSIKHSFDSYSPGIKPAGSLLAASNGKCYGLTVAGGLYNAGTLFEFDPYTGEYRKLHSFNGSPTGSNPHGSLIEATDSLFYGMTLYGGANGGGVIFKFDPRTNTLTKIFDFVNATGENPYGSLLQASNGKLYGMTSFGGGGVNYNRGILFEFNLADSSYSVVHYFNTVDGTGRGPRGSLIETSPGILYGLTHSEGANSGGTLFLYDIAADTTGVKVDFSGSTTGYEATGDPLLATNGKLYGMTSKGGAIGHGTIFEYDISGDTYTKVHDFQGSTTGKIPFGSLVESSDGKLYGLTSGEYDDLYDGTLFSVDTFTHTVTCVIDFDTTSAYKPRFTQLIKILVHADWTGAVSTDWHNPANWLQDDVPSVYTEVVIPDVSGASGNFPAVSSDVHVRDLTIEPGAQVDLQNGANVIVGTNSN